MVLFWRSLDTDPLSTPQWIRSHLNGPRSEPAFKFWTRTDADPKHWFLQGALWQLVVMGELSQSVF
jgi:hypothetical protein